MADQPKPKEGLFRAIVSRLFAGLVSLIFISFVTFVANEFAPGDAATVKAGDKATPAQVQRLRHEMGLDRAWPIRYVEFVGKAARFDFGNSYFATQEPVNTIVARALPMTLKLAGFSIIFATLVGVFMGVIAAIKAETWIDRVILSISTLGVTLPNFVIGPVLVFVFAVKMDVVPTTWEVNLRYPEWLYWVLPVLVLSARTTATLTRLTRASMLDTLSQEYIRLAVAKGLSPTRIYIRHALRNAILPVTTAIGTSFGYLLTGSFVVETVFTMPGLGFTGIDAILKGDSPLILATTLVAGAIFVMLNLVVDLILPLIDPRIRESQI